MKYRNSGKKLAFFVVFSFFTILLSKTSFSQCTVNAGNDTTICQGTNLVRTATTAPNNAQIQWYLQGNSTNILSTTASLNITPTVADTFYYIIKVSSGSCSAFDTIKVIVRPSPRVNAGSNQTVCQGSPLNITASVSPSSSTINWYLLGNTTSLSTTTTLNVATNTGGTFDYVIKADSANTCSSRDTVRVTINPKPVAGFTFTSNCGRKFSFNSSASSTASGSITSYQWNFGDGGNNSTSDQQNPNHNFPRNSSGQAFNVSLIITNSFGCKDTVSQQITIGSSPYAILASDQQTTTINGQEYFYVCASGTSELVFYNNSQNYLSTSTYQINWGDGSPLENYDQTTFPAPLSSNITQSHFYAPGTYNLSFLMSNGSCVDSVRYKIFVGSIPAGGLTRNQSQTICTDNPETVNIQNTSSNTPGTIYTLTFNDGSTPITLVAPISDPYTVTHIFDTSSCGTNSTNGSIIYSNAFGAYLTVQNPCGSTSSAVVPIFVASKPKSDFTITPYDSICVGQIIKLTNTGDAGQNVDAATQTCNPGKVIWQINPVSPGTRFQVQSGSSLGLIQTAQVNNWISGTDIVNIRFDSAGIYTIRQITSNASSCSGRDTVTKTICVNPQPTAAFNLSPDLGCAPLRVNANGSTNIPTCGQNTYQWGVSYIPINGCVPASSDYAYVDGTSANSQNPHFNFVNPGLYIISLQTIAPNARCSSTVIKDTVTVKGNPVVSITPATSSICVAQSISPTNTSSCFIDASTTYTWSFPNGNPSSSNSSAPGPISYSASGTYNIGLSVTNSCGTTPASASLTVNPLPSITGNTNVCVNASVQLTGSASPATNNPWISSNTAVATVSSSGVVTGVTAGTSIITYTNNNGCSNNVTVTVNPLPTITGNAAICVGSSLTLTGSATATTTNPWVSSNTGVATITNGGVVTAIGAGTSNITYTNSNGCQTSVTFTVRALPTITGNTTICLNRTSQLSGSGTAASSSPWTSSSPAVATVSNSGLVTALSVGSTTITYTDNNGCFNTITVIIKPLPSINGSSSICVGSNVSYTATTNPSLTTPWSSSNTGVATVNSSGSVTGVASGTSTITYTDEFGCQATLLVTVSSSPTASISYPTAVCTNQTNQNVTLTGATGGTFSISPVGTTGLSLNTSTGAINPSMSTAGTYTVNYNIPAGNGCSEVNVSNTVTITTTPTAPTVSSSPVVYCQGVTASALTATATGTNTLLFYTASNGGTGVVSLIPSTATATSTTYYVSQVTTNGCEGPRTPINVTVNPLPTITGNAAICAGSSLTLTGSATAATTSPWVSSNTVVATITSGGVVTAIGSGTTNITYTNSNGCQLSETVTVRALPNITGNTTICLSSTSQLTGSVAAATTNPWTSSAPNVATISNSGLVTAVSVGSTIITYTDINGCVKTTTVIVKPLPSINGSSSICVGSNVSFTGTTNPSITTPWSSSNTGVATVNSSGLVTGVASGTSTIAYTDDFGCQATLLVTVSSSPTATISYPTTICTNQTNQNVTLTGATGGTFSISPVGTTGLSLNTNTGAINPSTSTAGTYTVNYDIPAANGCPQVNVNNTVIITTTPAAPVATGNNICSGNTLQLNTSYTGSGTPSWSWSGPNNFTSNLEDPTITNVTTAASGTYSVTVTINGCTSPAGTTTLVVNQTPATPTPSSNTPVCSGNALTLSASTTSTMPVTWSWSGPNSFTSNNQNPQVSASATTTMTGNYIVTATSSYTNPVMNCPSASASTSVVVNPTPVINSSSSTDPTNCATPTGTILLNGLTANTAYEVHYTGPSGAITIPSITANASGGLTISSLVAGSYSNVYVVLTNCPSLPVGPFNLSDPNPPSAPLAPVVAPICDGEQLNLSASTSSSGTPTWSWSGPNGFSSSLQNPVINSASTAATGLYNVTVTINSCTSPALAVNVVVNPRPVAPIATSPVVYCQYEVPQALTATTLPSHTLLWYTTATGGAGSATAPTPSTAGTGTVSYYVSQVTPQNCEGPRARIDVIVNPTPVVSNQTQTICSGASFTITPSGPGVPSGTLYSWSAPAVTGGMTGGNPGTNASSISGSLSNPTDFVQTATYTVTPITGNCPGAIFTVIITVNPAPHVTFSPGNQTICSDETTQSVTIISPTPGVSIPWVSSYPSGITGVQNSGNSSIPAQLLTNITVNPITVTYTAVAITSGASGCPGDSSRYYVTVNPKPVIPNQSLALCSRQNIRFVPANNPPTTIVPAGTTYVWTFTDNPNVTGESNQSIGTDTIRQTLVNLTNTPQVVVYQITPTSGAAGNCVGAPFTFTVTVNPTPEIPTQTATICSGNSFTISPTDGQPNASTIVPAGTTYSWSAPVLPAGVSGAVSGSNQPNISGSLTNTTFAPITITYVVTPTSGAAGNCPGTPFNVDITVNPRASINNNPLNQSVCNGNTTQAVNWSSYTAGATYSWTVVSSGSVTGFLPAGTGNTLGTMTLTNTGIAQDSVVYAVSSTASACSGPATNYIIYVNPDAKAAITFPYDTACWPYAIVINNTSPRSPGNVNIPNVSYDWYTISNAGATTYLGSGTNFPGYTIPGPSQSITIKMVANSFFGCKKDSVSHTFYTKPKPTALFSMTTHDSCGPLTVSFTNLTNTSIIDTFRYSWNFGNGQTSNLQQPNPVTFLANPNHFDTTYIVTLTAFNECDTSTYIDSVIVRADPKARFFVSSTSGCSPFNIQISNTSLGNPTMYYWDFGDGATSSTTSAATFSHTYLTGVVDTFKLTLVAVSNCGTDTTSLDIRVAPNIIRPGVNINATELYGCVAHTVNFINSTSGATSFTWDFGDASPLVVTSVFQNIVQHTYNAPGTYTVHVAMTNGCSDTAITKQVTVYPKPTAAFTTNQTVYCLGDTTRVINTSLQASSYLWNWGSGATNTGFQPTQVYTTPGTYTISLQAQVIAPFGVVCFDTVSHPITVLNKPDSTLITNISNANCSPFVLTASTPGIINESVTWYVYDTTVAGYPIVLTGPSLQYTFNQPGTYNIEMIAENAAGCKDSATRTLTVYQKPNAGFTPLNLSTCSMDTLIGYINTSTANNYTPLTYKWYVNGLQRATSGNFNYRYITAANTPLPYTYQTKLVATNIVGCADSITGLLQINPTAKSSFVINNPNACIPFAANITDNSTYATNYSWYVNGVLISNSPTPILNFTSANTSYTVTLIVSNSYACKPDTSSFTFRTRIMPKAIFTLDNYLSCTGSLVVNTNNTSLNANAYEWEWGDGLANSTLFNTTHLYSTVGTYRILLTAKDGTCTDTTSKVVIVSQKPTVNFAANILKGCDTTSIRLINLTTNANSYLWVVSNGMTSTQLSPTFALPPNSVPYTIQLIATNQQGCKDSLTKANYIKVDPRPVADFYINPAPTISIPDYTFSFTNLTLNSILYKYEWWLGDGTYAITRDVVDHLYPDTGSYPVRLIVLDTSTNCADTVIKIARIEGYPGYLYVPNAFYPNSIRTQFKSFKPLGKGLAEYELQIFDSWGKLLFRTTRLDAAGIPVEGWDGTFNGRPVPQDSYAWYIKAKFRSGQVWDGMHYNQRESGSQGHTFGTVTLFR